MQQLSPKWRQSARTLHKIIIIDDCVPGFQDRQDAGAYLAVFALMSAMHDLDALVQACQGHLLLKEMTCVSGKSKARV